MQKGLDRQVRLALRAARALQTELGNSAALASGPERFAIIGSARGVASTIEGLKALLRRSESENAAGVP